MSNIGLNANIYHSTRVYLDLLNNFLIDYNYAKEIGKPYNNEEVINFFIRISENSNDDPEYQLLRSFFSRFYKIKKKDTQKELFNISERLQKSDVDRNILKEIEALVDVLKFQCAQAYARMKGIR